MHLIIHRVYTVPFFSRLPPLLGFQINELTFRFGVGLVELSPSLGLFTYIRRIRTHIPSQSFGLFAPFSIDLKNLRVWASDYILCLLPT